MTKKEYKNIIDTFITNRYEYLVECAKNIIKGKKTDPYELVSELTLFLYENKEKLQPFIGIKMLEGFSVSWLKTQGHFATSPFNRKFMNTLNNDVEVPDTEVSQPEIDLENVDEYVVYLRQRWNDKQIEDILKIHSIYPTLSPKHKVLFDAYFLENLSYDKIRKKYTFFMTDDKGNKVFYKTRSSIYLMMKELKDEIKKQL